MDRSAINRALSKALAYKNVGKSDEAEHWALETIRQMENAGLLRDGVTDALCNEVLRVYN